MTRKNFSIRTSMIALGGVALSLSLLRCSPISLSQSKLRSVPGGTTTPIGPNGPGSIKPIGGSGLSPGEQGSALTNIQSSVQELQAYQTEIAALPVEQRLTIRSSDASNESLEALEAFKKNRSITLHFKGHAPDTCKVYFGLSMSELMISNYGWNSAVHPIATDCSPLPDGNWKISVSQNVSQDIWALLSPNLEALTIFVANNPHMTVVPANPAPEHTPGGVHVTPKP